MEERNAPFIYVFIISLINLTTAECLLYFSVLSPGMMEDNFVRDSPPHPKGERFPPKDNINLS